MNIEEFSAEEQCVINDVRDKLLKSWKNGTGFGYVCNDLNEECKPKWLPLCIMNSKLKDFTPLWTFLEYFIEFEYSLNDVSNQKIQKFLLKKNYFLPTFDSDEINKVACKKHKYVGQISTYDIFVVKGVSLEKN